MLNMQTFYLIPRRNIIYIVKNSDFFFYKKKTLSVDALVHKKHIENTFNSYLKMLILITESCIPFNVRYEKSTQDKIFLQALW